MAAAALIAMTPADASHSWNGYHWAGNGTTLNLVINTAIAPKWETSVGDAFNDWNSGELSLTRKSVSVDARRCNPIPGQVLVCNYSYGKRGWLGIASIWLESGSKHITQATTKLNDSYHDQAPYNSPAYRALVACQEIGHDFGLAHQDEAFSNKNLGSCMDYTNAPQGGVYNGFDYGPPNIAPNAHDYAQMGTIYNHNDGYTTAKATSTNFGIRQVGKAVPQALPSAGSGDSPSEWGRAFHRDGKGRPDMFVKELAGGQRVVTHVFWAPDAHQGDHHDD